MTEIDDLYRKLMTALEKEALDKGFMDENISIKCKPLSAREAIGIPDHQDYPILKGKEAMVDAEFRGARGQAFSDTYGNRTATLKELLAQVPENTRQRAEFVAALNAVYRHLGLVEDTIHCKDNEPVECAQAMTSRIAGGMHVLLVGLQPRILEELARRTPVKAVDLDPDNIGTTRYGVEIMEPRQTREAMDWCHLILATGSTLVNGTLPAYLKAHKPVIFYGVTIAAAARILNLDRFCFCGH